MFQNVERYVSFIIVNNLTQEQFLLLYLLYRKKWDSIIAYKTKYITGDNTVIGKSAQQDLIDRGFMIKIDPLKTNASNFQLTEKFTKLFLNDIYEATAQFYDKYPGFVNINSVNAPLHNIDRYEFAHIYGERIDYSVDEHLEVMKDLEYGLNNNLLKSNLKDFLHSEGWRKIRELRLQEMISPNGDNIKRLDNVF